ncbi:MAG TPA: selenoneine synthase SenA [Noviherbaspirillum sp.]
MNFPFRTATPSELAAALQEARTRTLLLFETFAAAGVEHPPSFQAEGMSSPRWELGHIAWFAEWYVLRDARSSDPTAAHLPSLLSRGDDWFDANTLEQGGAADLPSRGALKTYCHEVLDRVLDKLSRTQHDDESLYPYRLVLAHEDMWGERWMQAFQLLGLALPAPLAEQGTRAWGQGEISFPGGTIQLGSPSGHGFVFDNEQWAHDCYVPPFAMDDTLVENVQFAEFVADGGYQDARYWTTAGRAWLVEQGRSAPRHWRRGGQDGHEWRCLRFGREIALAPHEPVRHLNLYEAQAYCRWARRRLPSEAEWEYAAQSGHAALRWGDLWEWTASPFEPYPGFAPGAWTGYSEPYFGKHQVLRGASFATPARMRSLKFRGFRWPEDDTLFAGFRTCAL